MTIFRGDFSVIQRSYGAREWQKDDAVSCCHLCGMVFGYVMERRHHCRACGRIFCWRCTQHMYILPHDRRSFCIPPPNNNWWPWAAPEETKDQKVRVCDGCFVELEGWANAMMWTTVCEAAGLTVPQLWELCAASRVLRTSAMSILNTLRDLLYSLPGRRAPSHFALLWTNRHHLRGHSRWVVQLLKLLPADKWRDPETREFMRGAVEEMMTDCKVARKANCWAMMCSRLCQSAFTTEDAVEMLCDLARVPEAADLRRLCIARLQTCSDAEVRCFLPLLVQLLRAVPGHMAPEAEPLTAFLVDRAVRDKTLGCELYWSLTVAKASEVPGARALYRTARHRLRDRLFAETDLKVLSVEALERFVEALEALQPLASADPPQVQARLRSLVPQADYFGAEWPFVVPTSPTQRCTSLLVDQTKFMTSNARPVRLAFACADRDAPGDAQSPPPVPGQSPLRAVHFDDSAGREVVSLYKRDDLRVDCIIMSVIRYMKLVLDKEFSDASIGDMVVTYNVVPVSPKAGFIEWVPNCKDVFSINNRDEVNMQSWVYRQPVNRLDTLANVQKRFVESTAAYTVISYLLGVGDRHKHNFMVTTKGMFFHIDYGYVLGLNPNSICMRAHLRLTKQMVAFMGGLDSDGYRDFKHLMIKIFHCLRRRYSIIMRMLLLLAEADPVIEDGRYSRSLVEAEIVSRFAPDKKDKDAEQAFLRRLESDADDQDETWGDLAHRISTDRVVPGMLWKAATTVSETAAFVGSNAYHIGCQLSAGAQDYLGSRGQAQ